jgi:GT2 family glycosyltransferase/glycosyltransferase involved in cell wall biosynthesis
MVQRLHADLQEFQVQGLRVPSAREITAFVDPMLHRQRSSVSPEDYLSITQAALAASLVDGTALEREIPSLSRGSVRVLEEYEQAVAEKRRQEEAKARLEDELAAARVKAAGDAVRAQELTRQVQQAQRLSDEREAELREARASLIRSEHEFGDACRALNERKDSIAELESAIGRARVHAERLSTATTWRVAHRLAVAADWIRLRRSHWNAVDVILRLLATPSSGTQSTLPAGETPTHRYAGAPLQAGRRPTPSLPYDRSRADEAPSSQPVFESQTTRQEHALRGKIAARMAEPPSRGAVEIAPDRPTGWPLAPAEEGSRKQPTVDVIVCVHNALEDVTRCLDSLLAKTTWPFRLIIVDDGSDGPTQRMLASFVDRWPQVTLLRNAREPHGYTIAANIGLRASDADFVVLLNSDTIVTPSWLEALLEVAYADEHTGMVGPLSNAATHQSLPELRAEGTWAVNELPAWLTEDGMAFVVSRLSQHRSPVFPFLNGFCLGLRRETIEAVGLLDEETFAAGYGEESDYAQRARAAGFRLVVADAAYVFHAKSKSYGESGRRPLAKAHYKALLRKHGEDEINRLVQGLEKDRALVSMRAGVAEVTSSLDSFVAAFPQLEANPLSILFIIPGVSEGSSGGVHSIYQEVGGMLALGINARIAAPAHARGRATAAYSDANETFLFFDGEDDLFARARSFNVVVATHYVTVPLVARLQHKHEFLAGYYVQDYEPFFADERSESAEEALKSFTMLESPLLFAKTKWLCEIVAAKHGVRVAKVEPSIDREIYHPGAGRRIDGSPMVVAMVRPRTPRRQPASTLKLVRRLQDELGDAASVEIFGCTDAELAELAPWMIGRIRNHGVLPREGVARVLASADVFVDMSVYQAFGRTALEAMSCGATVVAPQIGACSEFVLEGHNGMLVDTADDEAVFAAVRSLVRSPDVLRQLQRGALQTATGYSVERASISEYVTFAHWRAAARNFGTPEE